MKTFLGQQVYYYVGHKYMVSVPRNTTIGMVLEQQEHSDFRCINFYAHPHSSNLVRLILTPKEDT